MKKYNGTIHPKLTFPETHCCPKCGRFIGKVSTGRKTETTDFRRYYEINWDKKGKFYYIANRTHSPLLCHPKRRNQ